MNNVAVKTGSIYDAMMQTEKLKQKFESAVNDVKANRNLSEEGKQKEVELLKQDYIKNSDKLKAGMIDAVEEIKSSIAGKPYEYSADLEHSIDFIKTMADAGILTDAMFTHEMDKYRGREMDYVFAREKLKGSIPVERFDAYTFSTYGDYDVNGKRAFISPLEHFNKLEEYIAVGNNIMAADMLEQTENKLGIESVSRQNYTAKQKAKLQTMRENTPQLI